MKKIFVILVAVAFALTANAQVYLGGSLGFNWQTAKRITNPSDPEAVGSGLTSKNLGTYFSFTPTIGYRFNEKWAAGLDLDLYLQNSSTTDHRTGAQEQVSKNGQKGWAVAPFARYNLFKIKKFGIDLRLSARIGTSKTIQSYQDTEDALKYLDYGATFCPILTLDINEHFALESALGFASIAWEGHKATSNNGEYLNMTSVTENYLRLGLQNTTAIAFGCIYKF